MAGVQPPVTATVTATSRLSEAEIGDPLLERGYAQLPALLGARDCRALIAGYADRPRFRSVVNMAAHGFGRGEYRYWANPLPPLVAELRERLYPPLAAVANRAARALGAEASLPATLTEFQSRCHAAGQTRPTPLLLRYGPEDYNCLHQDTYGEVAFPLQVAVCLSQPGEDFEGGSFLLLQNRARRQSRGEALVLERGDAVVFPNRDWLTAGARGPVRCQFRHGVSRVVSGERYALGIIFHDAR
ncbi:MAG: 2OG-Fe(II) oxygenase [Proteobacteria bacterium]|nr:2OG-Fe(II) oxygenase [Pseudomonadota bacterium]